MSTDVFLVCHVLKFIITIHYITIVTNVYKEYRKVDSVLRSVEEEERDEFTGGHFLKKITGFKTCITITLIIYKPHSWNFTHVRSFFKNSIFYYGIYWCLATIRLELSVLWRSKYRRNRFVINEIWKLISSKLLMFRFHKGNLM